MHYKPLCLHLGLPSIFVSWHNFANFIFYHGTFLCQQKDRQFLPFGPHVSLMVHILIAFICIAEVSFLYKAGTKNIKFLNF